MNHVLTVAARDLRERAFVFLTAVVLTVMPFLVALVHGVDRRAVILIGGFIASVNLTIGVALAIGATMIGRDLSDRRLSFYFAKPIPASAIWFGKLLAAIVTVAVVFAIGFVPTYLAAGSAWQSVFSGPVGSLATAVIVGAFSLVLVAHGVSTIVRSRSPLIALDLVLFTVAVVALWLIEITLLAVFAFGVATTIVKIALLAVPTAIAFGGAWQLSRGRTDIRRSHRELSQFFWVAMAVVIAGLGAYDVWVLSAGPTDLRNKYAASSPRGDWFFLNGNAKNRGDYAPTFLVNAANGRSIRTRASRWGGIQFTRRGDAAILLSTRVKGIGIDSLADVAVLPLDGSGRRIDVATTVPLVDPVLVVSDDLRRLATFNAHTVSVHDISSNALLGSARVPYGDSARMFFVDPNTVRVYVTGLGWKNRAPYELRIYEFSVASRQLRETGRLGPATQWRLLQVSSDGSTMIATRQEDRNLLIADGRTGAIRGTIETSSRSNTPALLPDGRIAFVDAAKDVVIRIFDSNGAPLRDIPIDAAAGRAFVSGGVAGLLPGGKLLVSIRHAIAGPTSDLFVIDAQNGAIVRAERNAGLRTQLWSPDPRIADVQPAELVIADRAGTLWRWNVVTGAKAKIL